MKFAKAKSPTRPPTKKQIDFLISVNLKVPETFDEASAEIEDYIEKSKDLDEPDEQLFWCGPENIY